MFTIIFGTRPEYLKIKPLIRILKQHALLYNIFHISQHEYIDIDPDEGPITYIQLAEHESMTRLCLLSTEIMSKLDHILNNTSYLLVQGDTATVFFSALSAFHKRIPIFHLEAGLRTYDLQNPFPEEAYRSMLSRIATYHLCPDHNASYNLANEKITQNVHIVGNTILDLIQSYHLTPTIGNNVLITIHRRENWDTLLYILEKINQIALNHVHLQFKWILHPNPSIRSQINDYRQSHVMAHNLSFSDPLVHREMATCIASAAFLITDSGGIQEEASFLGKHCYVIRKTTERDAIPSTYITLVPDIDKLNYIITSSKIELLPSCTVYGNGTASEHIIQIYNQVVKNKS
jgi:UDP-N-acetylglucosamine 2-epimerase (non-hydrolysing)